MGTKRERENSKLPAFDFSCCFSSPNWILFFFLQVGIEIYNYLEINFGCLLLFFFLSLSLLFETTLNKNRDGEEKEEEEKKYIFV